MSIRPVLRWPDPRLSQTCAPTEGADVTDLIVDLFDTLYASGGRGLAAPQIGVLLRVFVIDIGWKEGKGYPMAFVDPEVTSRAETLTMGTEQCLSIPDLPMQVARPDWIWAVDRGGPPAKFEGVGARIFLHELDHLDGRVIFDHQDGETRANLEAAYGH